MSSAAIALAGAASAGADTTGSEWPRDPSRLDQLLESNDIPLDSEIPAIRKIISDNQARVDTLNARIDALRIAMEELIAERDPIHEYVRKLAAVISPVRRMPSDVMGQIFALTLPHTRGLGEAFKRVNWAPWRLGLICRSWRNWAVTDPFLWRFIIITQILSLDLGNTHPLSMIETQLLRSGNVPLDVDFYSGNCEDVDERRLWDLLLPQCKRWSTIRLRCWKDLCTLFDLLDSVRGRVPQLKKVQVYGRGGSLVSQPNCFSIAPNLREVTLADPKYMDCLPLCIPWGQITCYRGRFSVMRQLEILGATANLVECGLSFIADNPLGLNIPAVNIPGDTIIPLPQLHRLYVGDGEFLTRLTAPALEVLCSVGATDSLQDFANRSACRLTRLVLEKCTSADTVVRFLTDVQSLEYLLVEASHWDSAAISGFFNALTISGASSDLCPSLSSLAYGYSDGVGSFHPDSSLAMVTMAESRFHPKSSCHLSSLRFFSRSNIYSNHYKSRARFYDSIVEGIQILADRGLDVAFIDIYQENAFVAQYRP